jgi:hypothetical protein
LAKIREVISKNSFVSREKLISLECRRVSASQHAAAAKFWDELPYIFKLPSWPELNAMKRAAMGEEEEEDDEDEDEDDDE